MAMKETEGSLRTYFVLAGVGSIILALSLITTVPTHLVPITIMVALWFPIITYIPLGLGFTMAGLKLKAALLGDPSWILRLLQISGVISVIRIGLAVSTFRRSAGTGSFISAGISVLITWYLYANVNRLAREAKLRADVPSVPAARVIE